MSISFLDDVKQYKIGHCSIHKDNTKDLNIPCPVRNCKIRKIKPDSEGTTSEEFKHLSRYCTGSSYEGNTRKIGFSGQGMYKYPHGVKYEGNFRNGQFHGKGVLSYPEGQTIEGIWYNGRLTENNTFRFADKLKYSPVNWDYIQFPDRLFNIDKSEGLQPAGNERLTGKEEDEPIPEYCYYMGDNSYYDDREKLIYWNNGKIRTIVQKEQENFIPKHFRQNADKNVGYHPEFYEYFCSGSKKKVAEITNKLSENEAEVEVPFIPSLGPALSQR